MQQVLVVYAEHLVLKQCTVGLLIFLLNLHGVLLGLLILISIFLLLVIALCLLRRKEGRGVQLLLDALAG